MDLYDVLMVMGNVLGLRLGVRLFFGRKWGEMSFFVFLFISGSRFWLLGVFLSIRLRGKVIRYTKKMHILS